MKVPLTLRDHIDRAVSVYPDRVGVGRRTQPAGAAASRRHLPPARRAGGCAGRGARRSRRAVRRACRDGVAQRGASRRVVLRRVGQRPGVRAHQLPVVARRGRVHRRALRCRCVARRPRGRGCAVEHLVSAPLRDRRRERRGHVPFRRRAEAVGARRRRHGDDQLHVGHHRPTQGCRADASSVVAQLSDLRLADRGQRSRCVPAHVADVPLQRMGHALRAGGDGRTADRVAQDRRCRDPSPHRTPWRDAALWRPCRRRGHPRRGRLVGRPDPGPRHACAWWSPARRRPRGRSSAWRPSSVGSSSRSTG